MDKSGKGSIDPGLLFYFVSLATIFFSSPKILVILATLVKSITDYIVAEYCFFICSTSGTSLQIEHIELIEYIEPI